MHGLALVLALFLVLGSLAAIVYFMGQWRN